MPDHNSLLSTAQLYYFLWQNCLLLRKRVAIAVSERSSGPAWINESNPCSTTALPSNTEKHSSHSVSYNTLCIMWFVAHRYSPHSCSISVLTSTSAVERSRYVQLELLENPLVHAALVWLVSVEFCSMSCH